MIWDHSAQQKLREVWKRGCTVDRCAAELQVTRGELLVKVRELKLGPRPRRSRAVVMFIQATPPDKPHTRQELRALIAEVMAARQA